MGFNTNGAQQGRPGSWGRAGQLSNFSRAYGSLVTGQGTGPFGTGHTEHFFVPSYLKGSRYIEELEEAHKAKVLAQKEASSATGSQAGSLSTSTSSINLHSKIAPSHRGITYDVIEKAPPVEEEACAPLPTRWNDQDKYGGLELLSDGQEVKFTGVKSSTEREYEACAIRADHPMPSKAGIYYFEVTIISRKREEYAYPYIIITYCHIQPSNLYLGPPSASASHINPSCCQDCLGGSRIPGHTMETMGIHSARIAQVGLMVRLSQLAM